MAHPGMMHAPPPPPPPPLTREAFQDAIEAIVGYPVMDLRLYEDAVTHPSAVENKVDGSYERLEFLGDASLNMTIASFLFSKFPRADEGQLTKVRSRIVSTENMATLARCLNLGALVRIGEGAKPSLRCNSKVLEDVLEALIGAIYLDMGQSQAKEFFLGLLDKYTSFDSFLVDHNAKDASMRLAQALGHPLPQYTCGPAPDGVYGRFQATILLCGVHGVGLGCSKREAELEKRLAQLENHLAELQKQIDNRNR
jgi:ribonuclease-3